MAFKKPCKFCDGGDGMHRIDCQNPDKAHVIFWYRHGEKVPRFLDGIVDEARPLEPDKEPS